MGTSCAHQLGSRSLLCVPKDGGEKRDEKKTKNEKRRQRVSLGPEGELESAPQPPLNYGGGLETKKIPP